MKKTIIFFITLCMAITNFTLISYAAKAPEDFEKKAVRILDMLGITDADEYQNDKTVTRAEFIKAAITEYGLSEAAQIISPSGFSDVPEEYDGYVSVAKNLGIINGFDNSTFNPYDPVTFEQALKICVLMLGYKIKAESTGGYADGYIKTAQSIRLLDNVRDFSPKAEISMRSMVCILYNVLETELVETKYNTGGTTYEAGGATILHDRLEVYKAEGIVTANSVTGIDSADLQTPENTVRIKTQSGAGIYDCGKTDAEDMLGYDITAYYREDGGENVILGYIINKTNNCLTIEADDIVSVSAGDITYNEGNSVKKARIAGGVRIIYNGRVVSSTEYNISLLDIECGSLRLLSPAGNVYETVFVQEYSDALFTGVNDDKLYFSKSKKVPSQIIIDKLDSLRLIKDNEDVLPEELQKGWVASVERSLDGMVMTVRFSDKSVSGRITGNKKDDDKQIVTINGEEYKISKDVADRFNSGDSGVYLLNAYSEIFSVDENIDSLKRYAYIVHKGENNDDELYQIRIFDQDGEMKLVTLADNVTLDKTRVSAMAAYNSIPEYSLIQYSQNSDNRINKVYTPIDYTNVVSYVGYDEDNFSRDNPVSSMYFKSTKIPSFGGIYLAEEDTTVFNIPQDKTDYDNYIVTGTDIFLNDVFYNVELYDANRQRHVSAVVNNGVDLTSSNEAVLPWNSPIFVINDKKTIHDDIRGTVDVLTGYKDGEEITIIPAQSNNTQFPELGDVLMEDPTDKNSILFSELKKGNIIQYKLNAKKEVDSFRVLYNESTPLEIRSWNGSTYAINLLTAVAMVSYIDDTTICITIDDNSANSAVSNRVFALPEDINVYIYDKDVKKVTTGSLQDIISMDNSYLGADKVFIRSYRDSINEIVILRRNR